MDVEITPSVPVGAVSVFASLMAPFLPVAGDGPHHLEVGECPDGPGDVPWRAEEDGHG